MKDLDGRVAVVTGAGGGIGEGIALAAAEAGMKRVCADIEADNVERVAEAIRGGGGEAIGVACDVTDPAAVEGLAASAFDAFGAAHLLCNNAGVIVSGRLADSTEQEWRWLLGVNLHGVMNGVRAFVPRMRGQQGGGHILNTGSLASLLPLENTGIYCVTKYSVLAISEVLAQELAADGIGVSILCPGGVDTQINQAARNRPTALGGPEASPEALSVAEEAEQRSLGGDLSKILSPREVGDIALAGVRAGELYIPTHPAWKEAVAGRFEQVLGGFDATAQRLG